MTTKALQRVRVAIYCRKSVTEGLDQEFNSLDAQRQAVEAYIRSQAGLGWIAIEKRYDDGGFSGSNTDRPAFQGLLKDILDGNVDVVAVYKIDRLSRSSRDFVRILDLFDQHKVAFVSVTQQFSTTNSMGKLVLNILMSFSEFERDVISERIRDKIRASRRRGMWTGGRPILGYDVVDKRLVINKDEAHQVRETYQLYMTHGSVRATCAELARRGWRNKSYCNRAGRHIEGNSFSKATLHALLTNPLYRGNVRCGDEIARGVHDPIVDEELWTAVQNQLQANCANGGAKARNKTGAVLRGLVHCGLCGSPMTHTFSTKQNRRYRYYTCTKNHNVGSNACKGARVSAGKFEAFITQQIRAVGQNEDLIAATADCLGTTSTKRIAQLDSESRRLEQEHRRLMRERRQTVVEDSGDTTLARQRDGEIDKRLKTIDNRQQEVGEEVAANRECATDAAGLRQALHGFASIWDQLFHREKERILRLLVKRITYDPASGDTDLDLNPAGIQLLAKEAP